MLPKEILQKYWGHHSFRNSQEEIIDTVLSKKDIIALLPTGAGKSLCYQIPALVNEGICLVISPLISLMKDQTEQLEKKGIKALTIKSNATTDEIVSLGFPNLYPPSVMNIASKNSEPLTLANISISLAVL